MKGRVYEVSLADLQNEPDAERSFRKFKLICEDVQGKNCLCNFYGMNLTTDKWRSMVKKWQTLIEAYVDVKTTDGYLLRVFCIGFTQKQQYQTSKTCYAQAQQVSKQTKGIVVCNCWKIYPFLSDDMPNPFSDIVLSFSPLVFLSEDHDGRSLDGFSIFGNARDQIRDL